MWCQMEMKKQKTVDCRSIESVVRLSVFKTITLKLWTLCGVIFCENMAKIVFIVYIVIFLVSVARNEDNYFENGLGKCLLIR